jgi:hypothetical protein
MLATAIVAAVSAALSALAAFFALRIASQAREAADRQATATADAAKAAADSARIADAVARLETSRRHDELAPKADIDWNETATQVRPSAMYIRVKPTGPLDYTITGEKRYNRGGTPSYTELAPTTGHRGQWSNIHVYNVNENKPDQLVLRFDPVDGAPCPCGAAQTRGSGHWEMVVSVK